MPRFKSIGFAPAATDFRPSRIMACASPVAVVVPSPASSEVFDATSLTICAPMFSNLSLSSISLATETPALGTQRYLDGIRQNVHTPEHALPGVVAEAYVFCCHLLIPLVELVNDGGRLKRYLPSITAMTSSSRMTTSSSPSIFTSVPLYLPKRILSPTLRSTGRMSPFSVNGQRAARPDQPSRVAIEQSKGIRRALRVQAVQMHSVLIVATVDRGHGDSVGRLMRRWAQSAEQPTLLSRGRRTARRP